MAMSTLCRALAMAAAKGASGPPRKLWAAAEPGAEKYTWIDPWLSAPAGDGSPGKPVRRLKASNRARASKSKNALKMAGIRTRVNHASLG
jgi:hypothetical protein